MVMVVKNGMRHLPAALASLRRQTLTPVETIAVVGASEDGTLAYLTAQPDIRAIAQAGDGLAQARNQGLAAARGELIAFLDHDDLWHPRKLELQTEVLDQFARPGACITQFRTVREGGTDDPVQLPRLGWTPCALVAHREVFATVGGFDPATDMGCDTDWFRRLRRSGVPCGVDVAGAEWRSTVAGTVSAATRPATGRRCSRSSASTGWSRAQPAQDERGFRRVA